MFAILLVSILIFANSFLSPAYAQDGGDGVSGAGNDNTDYGSNDYSQDYGGDSGAGGEGQSRDQESVDR